MNTPSTKVTTAAAAVALAIIAVWGIETGFNIDLPAAVEAAGGTVLVFLAGYFVPERNPSTSARETIAMEHRTSA